MTFWAKRANLKVRLSGKPRISSVSDGVVNIELSLQWDNAWREGYNWDAVWLFFKYKTSDDNAWQHVNLDTGGCSFSEPSGGKDYFHSFGKTGGKAVGVFVYLSEDAFCDPIVKCKLQWTLPAGVTKADFDNNDAFLLTQAIEMVYIPNGAYQLGEPNRDVAFNKVLIASKSDSDIGLNGSSDITLSNDYPNGYQGFHVMKYEITQEQYVTFLNTLSLADQRELVPNLSALNVGDYVFGTSREQPNFRNGIIVAQKAATDPVLFATNLTNDTKYNHSDDGASIPCNYISVQAMQAYCSWSGLRPMSELEFEKAARDPYPSLPEPNEYAWGATASISFARGVSESGTGSESPSTPGQVNANNPTFGPLRSGSVIAGGDLSQQSTGSTYWGVREMNGNLREICAISSNTVINHSDHGDGTIGISFGGDRTFGYRGGSFATTVNSILQTSDRSEISGISNSTSDEFSGFRAVRTFSDDASSQESINPGVISYGDQTICPDGSLSIHSIAPASVAGRANVSFHYSWYINDVLQANQTAAILDISDLVPSKTYYIQRSVACILGDERTDSLKVTVLPTVDFAFSESTVWLGDKPTVHITTVQDLTYDWKYKTTSLTTASSYTPNAGNFPNSYTANNVIVTATHKNCTTGSIPKTLIVKSNRLTPGTIAISSKLGENGSRVITSTDPAKIDEVNIYPITYSWYVDQGSSISDTPHGESKNTPELTLATPPTGVYTIRRRATTSLGFRETSATSSLPSIPANVIVKDVAIANAHFSSSVEGDGGSIITDRGFVYSSTSLTPTPRILKSLKVVVSVLLLV